MKLLQTRFIVGLMIFAAVCVVVSGFASTGQADEALAPPQFAFSPGERLVFEIHWLFVPVGKAVLEIMPMETIDNKPVWHFTMTARTNKFADSFYKVRDKIDSYTDIDMTHTVFYKKKQREGDTKRDVEVYFDWDNNKATYVADNKKNKPIDIEPGSFDPLSIFYYFRTRNLKKGNVVTANVTDGKKCVQGLARVIKKHKAKTPAGQYDTLVVEPDLKHIGGVFKKSKNAKLRLWFSTGPNRYVVRIKSKVVVGSFVANLVSAEQIQPQQHGATP